MNRWRWNASIYPK